MQKGILWLQLSHMCLTFHTTVYTLLCDDEVNVNFAETASKETCDQKLLFTHRYRPTIPLKNSKQNMVLYCTFPWIFNILNTVFGKLCHCLSVPVCLL